MQSDNLEIVKYDTEIDLEDLFVQLKNKYGAEKVTIQSGGTMNAEFVRRGLIDKVSVVVAPALVGGKDTASLVDGDSLVTFDDLKKIKALKLDKAKVLQDSYLHLTYDVINETVVEV